MSSSHGDDGKRAPWRDAWNRVIFGNDTFAGRLFDLVLLILILLSVLTVLLESVSWIRESTAPPSGLRSGGSLHFSQSSMRTATS